MMCLLNWNSTSWCQGEKEKTGDWSRAHTDVQDSVQGEAADRRTLDARPKALLLFFSIKMRFL